MRATVSLDDNVAAAVVDQQRTADLGLRVDVSNVAEALDVLDGPAAR